jgi:hypothetical protein
VKVKVQILKKNKLNDAGSGLSFCLGSFRISLPALQQVVPLQPGIFFAEAIILIEKISMNE